MQQKEVLQDLAPFDCPKSLANAIRMWFKHLAFHSCPQTAFP
jgi:hypothetical protein